MNFGIVAIGRNEGERLRRCLVSARVLDTPVVYVDSGSIDGSSDVARALGVEVVDLDLSTPFTAARGRNVGFDRLLEISPEIMFVQFVDGDCEIDSGWLQRAASELAGNPELAVVCGRRRERFPDASIYNRLCDIEWNTPVGEIRSCGGDSMIRVSAFQEVKGFNASVAAGEEPEMCCRLRRLGWKILRIDADMTLHDAAIFHFGPWWKRQYRGGYGAMDLYRRLGFDNDPHYVLVVRSARLWTVGWITVLIFSTLIGAKFYEGTGAAIGFIAAFALIPMQASRIACRIKSASVDGRTAFAHGLLTVVGKWPQFLAQIAYLRDNRHFNSVRLIEYK